MEVFGLDDLAREDFAFEDLAAEVLALEDFVVEVLALEVVALEFFALEVFALEVFAREGFERDDFLRVAFLADDAALAEERPAFLVLLFIAVRPRDLPFFLAAMTTLLPLRRKAACSRFVAVSPPSIHPDSL